MLACGMCPNEALLGFSLRLLTSTIDPSSSSKISSFEGLGSVGGLRSLPAMVILIFLHMSSETILRVSMMMSMFVAVSKPLMMMF